MRSNLFTRQLLLIVGDIAAFYASLILALLLRYRSNFSGELLLAHVWPPFTIILLLGLVIYYGMRLYDLGSAMRQASWVQGVIAALSVHFLAAVFYFYFFVREKDSAAITPRGTLFLFFLVYAILFILWRRYALRFVKIAVFNNTLILGETGETKTLAHWIINHPESEHRIERIIPEEELSPEKLLSEVKELNIAAIIGSGHIVEKLAPTLLELAKKGIKFWSVTNFYETKVQKLPIEMLSESWALENIIRRDSPLESLVKRLLDFIASGAILIVFLPLWPFIIMAIKLTSPGPVFYSQTRVGKDGKIFIFRKFRTMRRDAELNGAQWAQENDPRITRVGKILRTTHLDELPQLISIFKGELSFVGPRPERPEFVEELTKKIPLYELRHIVRPGFTGWAQLNYPYGASIEDAKEKLAYDFYYLKHRSILLDASIILKTLWLFFHRPQR